MGYPNIVPYLNTAKYFRNAVIAVVLCSSAAQAGYLEDAQAYFDQKDYKSAIIQLKNALQENDQNGEARLLLGKSYLKSGAYDSAEKELRAALTQGIDDNRVMLPLGMALLRKGKADQVLETISVEQLASLDDKSEALAIIGHAHMVKNQPDEAKKAFAEALKNSRTPYAILGQARIALFEGDTEAGLKGVEEALKVNPNYTEALFTKAQILGSIDKYDEVVEVFDGIIEGDAKHVAARMARAEAQVRLGKLDMARKDSEYVLSLNDMQPQANFMMAKLQLDAREYEQAQMSAEKVLRAIPNHQMSFFILGTAHYVQENLEQSKFYLEKFIAGQPGHGAASRILGATYLKLGDPQSAVDLIEPLEKGADNQDAQLLNVLGRAYLQLGEIDKGTEALTQAVTLAPELEGARTQIALGQLASGNTREAIKQLEDSLAQDTHQGVMPRVMLILSYIKERMFDEAYKAVNQAITDNPKAGIFYNLKGMAHEAQLNNDEARESYSKAVEVDPEYLPALLSLGKLSVSEGELEKARSYYQSILKINAKHMQAQLALAQLAAQAGNDREFMKRTEQAKRNNPNAFAPVNMLATHYLQNKELDKALNEALGYQADHPENLGAKSLLARIYMAKGEPQQAKYYLQDVIDNSPKDIIHRMQMVQILASEGQMEDAMESVEHILTVDNVYLPALAARVKINISDKRYITAEEQIEVIAASYPDSHIAGQLRGDLLVAQMQSDRAVEAYEQAFAIAKTPYLVNTLVRLYVKDEKLEKAAGKLQQYIDQVPQDDNNRLRLATLYQQLKKNIAAIAHYEQLNKKVSGNAVVLNNLAWLYWVENDSRALDVARQANEADPGRAEIIDTLGWIMLHEGDRKEALDNIQQAASKAPTNPEIRYHLAVALDKNNQKEAAKKELTRLLRDYGDFPQAADARELLQRLEK